MWKAITEQGSGSHINSTESHNHSFRGHLSRWAGGNQQCWLCLQKAEKNQTQIRKNTGKGPLPFESTGLTFTEEAEVHLILPTLLIWTNASSQILSVSLLPGIKPHWLLFLSVFTERSTSHQQESSLVTAADALGLGFVLFWILTPQRRNRDFLIYHRCFKLFFLVVWCVTSWGWTLQILSNLYQNRTALLFSV